MYIGRCTYVFLWIIKDKEEVLSLPWRTELWATGSQFGKQSNAFLTEDISTQDLQSRLWSRPLCMWCSSPYYGLILSEDTPVLPANYIPPLHVLQSSLYALHPPCMHSSPPCSFSALGGGIWIVSLFFLASSVSAPLESIWGKEPLEPLKKIHIHSSQGPLQLSPNSAGQ